MVLSLILKVLRKVGLLPPHEFAYGTAVRNSDELAERMKQFLSLDALDSDQIQIETFVGNRSANNLQPLIRYISSQRDPDLGPVISALEETDRLSDDKAKAIQALETLLPHKESLRNESQQDSIIIFVYYRLKQPSELSPATKGNISSFVRQFDTATQTEKFDSGACPRSYLKGNINIYPLALDNTSWHNMAELDSPNDAPILEVRFMGLRGIFKYLLDEMTAKTGALFVHLDGDSL